MKQLQRQSAPSCWGRFEARWLEKESSFELRQALAWRHEGQPLTQLFHEHVRPASAPRLCAYCDGAFVESPETIDHFIPLHVGREWGLCWTNLFPSCVSCNSQYKRKQWSCYLLRPDVDPVEEWFLFEPDSGMLRPAPEAARRDRARVRLTIRVRGLNSAVRCKARRDRWKALMHAHKMGDQAHVEQLANEGPYRFVAEVLLAALGSLCRA